jgi:hypothetical protein
MSDNSQATTHWRSDVFISYRRNDTGDVVDRLEPALRNALPSFEIFRDTGGIAPAEDYLKVLQQEVERDWVFLAVIGSRWLGDSIGGRSRMDDPEDVLRREVEWRLNRSPYPLLPVLVDGASMPRESDLPKRMRGINRIQAAHLRSESFNRDVQELAARIKKLVEQERTKQDEAEAALDEYEAALEEYEDREDPIVTGPGVSVFQPDGSWLLTIESRTAPDDIAGPFGHAEIEFTITDEGFMQGVYRSVIGKRTFGGRKLSNHPIEGECLVFDKAGSSELTDKMQLQGVMDGVNRFAMMIPIHYKTGNVYTGTDADGRQFVLKLLHGGSGRAGF